MAYIYNDDDFINTFMVDFQTAIDKTTEEMLEKLEDLIKLHVYTYRPKVYQRRWYSGGLLGNWENYSSTINFNKIKSKITEKPSTYLDHAPDEFVHGSNYWTTDDVRTMLADIVTQYHQKHRAGSLFGSGVWTLPRDFWTPFLNLFKDGTADSVMSKNLRKLKISFIKR